MIVTGPARSDIKLKNGITRDTGCFQVILFIPFFERNVTWLAGVTTFTSVASSNYLILICVFFIK